MPQGPRVPLAILSRHELRNLLANLERDGRTELASQVSLELERRRRAQLSAHQARDEVPPPRARRVLVGGLAAALVVGAVVAPVWIWTLRSTGEPSIASRPSPPRAAVALAPEISKPEALAKAPSASPVAVASLARPAPAPAPVRRPPRPETKRAGTPAAPSELALAPSTTGARPEIVPESAETGTAQPASAEARLDLTETRLALAESARRPVAKCARETAAEQVLCQDAERLAETPNVWRPFDTVSRAQMAPAASPREGKARPRP